MSLPEPYYDRDGITIFNADCLEVLPALETVDHVITDPPFSQTTHAGARTYSSMDAEVIEFASFTEDQVFDVLRRASFITRRWIIASVDWRHMSRLEAVNEEKKAPLRFIRFGVWVKPDGAPQFSGDRPATGWEAVAIMHSTANAPKWNGGGHRAVWVENIDKSGIHPTAKPIGLIREWVEKFTDPGDLILDPFMGSGTTLRAAADLGRRAIGIEINEDYCRIAVERLRQGVLL